MNVKEVATLTGLTHQAIYKRIKAAGYKLDELKDKASGQFTPEGEAVLREMFNLDELQPELTTELTTKVAELTTEVEKLRNQVETLENERDFLRLTLEREQQLHGLTISKLPTPPPALPPSDAEKGRLRTWWDRIRGRA
jgi:chromosome segregation ATPase